MTHQLRSRVSSLAPRHLALFVGAGNVPLQWSAYRRTRLHCGIRLLITAVGLPVLTVVARQVGGGVDSLSTPIGKVAGVLLATVCYLAVGPLFATPRTATVSFEVGIAPLTGDSALPLFIYSLVYFAIVILVSLYPGKLLDTVGNFLAPLKIIALVILSVAAIVWRAGSISTATEAYQNAAFFNRFVNGYLTTDTLATCLVSLSLMVVRSWVTERAAYRSYRLGWPDGGCWSDSAVPFRLGSDSASLVDQLQTALLFWSAYVQHTFGGGGSFLRR
ncbi:branched-chain amino acid transport system II carrier protein [Escherichia coli]